MDNSEDCIHAAGVAGIALERDDRDVELLKVLTALGDEQR
jgi:hypothetical protein